jgi:hypothetical protein
MEADQQNHVRIIFIIVLIVLVILGLSTGSLYTSAALLLFGAWFWFIAFNERNQNEELEAIWSELARQTGLTFVPSKRSLLSYIAPRLFGEYRGRYVSISLEMEGGGEYESPTTFTKIAPQVINQAHVSLETKEKWWLTRRAGKRDILSGNHEFDRRFRVSGTPPDFAQRAIHLPALQNILLLDESQDKIMKTVYSRPTIKLKDWDLICLVHGVLTHVEVQTAMLNMLCDLADLAEQSGSNPAESSWRD